MKTIIFIAVIAFAAAEPDFYKLFKDLDLNYIMGDDQELDDFVDCVLDKGPCREPYESYKDLFSAAVKQKCHKCNAYQRHTLWMLIDTIVNKSPENFIRFREKYDLENKYFDALMDELHYGEH